MSSTILITGATGYVGQAACCAFLARGYRVIGLVRRAEQAAQLPSGVRPLVGDLGNPAAWMQQVTQVAVLVNAAFPSHGAGWAASVAAERRYLETLFPLLEGRVQKIVLLNGSAFLGDSGSGRLAETAPIQMDHPAAIRATNTAPATWASYPIPTIEARLASFIYGAGGSVFLPILLDHARRTGQSLYVGEGQIQTSTLQVEVAGTACWAAAQGTGGQTYHFAQDEEPTTRQIAEAIAQAVGPHCKAVSVDADTAAAALDPFTALFLTQNNRLDSRLARTELGWSGGYPSSLLWDVAHGSYALKS